jgi:hypothetical protein
MTASHSYGVVRRDAHPRHQRELCLQNLTLPLARNSATPVFPSHRLLTSTARCVHNVCDVRWITRREAAHDNCGARCLCFDGFVRCGQHARVPVRWHVNVVARLRCQILLVPDLWANRPRGQTWMTTQTNPRNVSPPRRRPPCCQTCQRARPRGQQSY